MNRVLFVCPGSIHLLVFQPLEYRIQQLIANNKVIDQKDPVTPAISPSSTMTDPQKYVSRHD
jgi:hypothetical protein